jgi:uncharacterized protein YjiS (DUF1127 family)
MTLTFGYFQFIFRVMPRTPAPAPRLFARGQELDAATAMAVSDLSPHLLRDIGVTDSEIGRKPMDRTPGL